MPEYKTQGAVAMDVTARETVSIPPHTVKLIPLNIAVEIPVGFFGILAARSSLHKMGIMPANGVGIMDQDYCGDNDEYKFAALNYTDAEVVVERGTRVGQIMVAAVEKMEIEEVEHMGNQDRGGFGTTGM